MIQNLAVQMGMSMWLWVVFHREIVASAKQKRIHSAAKGKLQRYLTNCALADMTPGLQEESVTVTAKVVSPVVSVLMDMTPQWLEKQFVESARNATQVEGIGTQSLRNQNNFAQLATTLFSLVEHLPERAVNVLGFTLEINSATRGQLRI
jgi:hypothetical protein